MSKRVRPPFHLIFIAAVPEVITSGGWWWQGNKVTISTKDGLTPTELENVVTVFRPDNWDDKWRKIKYNSVLTSFCQNKSINVSIIVFTRTKLLADCV